MAALDMLPHRAREMAGAVVTALRRLPGALASGLEDEREPSQDDEDSVTATS